MLTFLESPAAASADWSISIEDADSGEQLFVHHPARALEAASIGKLVLLGCVGAAMREEPLLAEELLERSAVEPVRDSGIWQHLHAEQLTVADAATLVFAASDNWATNVLLHRFGLDRVERFRSQLGLTQTVLCDRVRNERGPQDPPVLSRASAGDLAAFMARLWRGEVLHDPDYCRWFVDGLSLSLDLSMVGAPLGLDPLAHPGPHADPGLANKTGTDAGIRGDAGIVSAGGRRYAYACLANYPVGLGHDRQIGQAMQEMGRGLLRGDLLQPDPGA